MKKKYQNKKFLWEQYVNQGKCMKRIADRINCNETTIRRWLHSFGIPIRTHTEIFTGRKIT